MQWNASLENLERKVASRAGEIGVALPGVARDRSSARRCSACASWPERSALEPRWSPNFHARFLLSTRPRAWSSQPHAVAVGLYVSFVLATKLEQREGGAECRRSHDLLPVSRSRIRRLPTSREAPFPAKVCIPDRERSRRKTAISFGDYTGDRGLHRRTPRRGGPATPNRVGARWPASDRSSDWWRGRTVPPAPGPRAAARPSGAAVLRRPSTSRMPYDALRLEAGPDARGPAARRPAGSSRTAGSGP